MESQNQWLTRKNRRGMIDCVGLISRRQTRWWDEDDRKRNPLTVLLDAVMRRTRMRVMDIS